MRPIRPDDADALVALHARLSADTVYRRYSARGTLGLQRRTESDGETVTVLMNLSGSELPADRRERARRHLARPRSVAPP